MARYDEIRPKLLSHVQHFARQYLAWRGSLEQLAETIRLSAALPERDLDAVGNLLRREDVQNELFTRYETGLWRAADGTFRLVCLVVPTDAPKAARRVARKPSSPDQCRWCLIDEGRFAHLELIPEKNLRGIVPGSFVHPRCKRAWASLRAMAELKEVTE